MRRIASSLIIVLACVVASAADTEERAYQEVEIDSGGTIQGRVFFEEDYPEAKKRKVNIDADTCGIRVTSERFVVDPESKGLANAVLHIEGIAAGKPFSTAEDAISQLKCRYDPHVVIMRSGETLEIKNEDPVFTKNRPRSVRVIVAPFATVKVAPLLSTASLLTGKTNMLRGMSSWVRRPRRKSISSLAAASS